MNRRQFTQALTALFASPALPSTALAPAVSPAVSSAVSSTVGSVPASAYFWADYMTRLHNICTADMLAPFYKADVELAKSIHFQLVSENFLLPSGAAHPNLLARQPQKTFGQHNANRAHSATEKQAPKAQEYKMQNTRIRPAQAEDHDALTTIWHTGWIEAHADHVPTALTDLRTEDSFKIRLTDMLPNTFVTGPIGAPVGFCTIKNNEIYQMYVTKDARGTGAAAALISAGCDGIKKAGHDRASLDVIAENSRAIAFYEKMGWTSQGIRTVELDTLGDPFALDCVVMTKDLA